MSEAKQFQTKSLPFPHQPLSLLSSLFLEVNMRKQNKMQVDLLKKNEERLGDFIMLKYLKLQL